MSLQVDLAQRTPPYRDGRVYTHDTPRTVAPAPARVSVWGRIVYAVCVIAFFYWIGVQGL